ncbi:4-hydroxyphenylpyruvate dioxygenase [Cupriavidus necator H850]|jgi:4-hydroxyphenylpyruvate dioxygenase|uniref:4-hydroxyphenylpyruvate dioxygenase family protein n=1 Tax=Cupriavidus TaxID=106589 RepID=UPI00129ED63D|nr:MULTISPECIES: VOC family protein [Cupriavidus]KAI3608860.1 4-hydroxyphenylpyruvate dioxygenase [Cupriavidus necator H850]QUN30996.1 VOC family protein [Cupriavidus sp. KK10]
MSAADVSSPRADDFQTWDNPLGIQGYEFIEFASPDPAALGRTLERFGFAAIARHRHKAVKLYRQGEMNFIVDAEPDSFATRYASEYGLSICAIGIRVNDAAAAFTRALEAGAWPFEGGTVGPMELNIPAIQGIGQSILYFIDRWRGKEGRPGDVGDISIYDVDFRPLPQPDNAPDAGLLRVDHLTQAVEQGHLEEWLDFYRKVLGFRELQPASAAHALVSPCGRIRIPLYEKGTTRHDQMRHYLSDQHGEGIQHIALASADILASTAALAGNGVQFVQPPAAYYDSVDTRLPGHGLDLAALQRYGILADGAMRADRTQERFLQAFVRREAGEFFFEIVQRDGHQGFGEGNLPVLEALSVR